MSSSYGTRHAKKRAASPNGGSAARERLLLRRLIPMNVRKWFSSTATVRLAALGRLTGASVEEVRETVADLGFGERLTLSQVEEVVAALEEDDLDADDMDDEDGTEEEDDEEPPGDDDEAEDES
jgi:hypothetical protein